STDDAEGEITGVTSTDEVSDESISRGIDALSGEIQQVPTTVSAIKVDGRRAYDLARQGVEVELKARAVTISRFDVEERRDLVVDGSAVVDLDVVVECTSGTYIRALARDLGASLGLGGHLIALRRTRVGPFDVADAAVLPELDVASRLLAPADVALSLFPVLAMSTEQAVDLGHGKKLAVELPDGSGPVAAITPAGRLAGLVAVKNGVARPIVNFPTDEVLP
ncbi:MAG: tRNA pseudouridine synthase, partial [Frondihabitans sp.]|nr:tRNA pseudouridine synthase [Frondihabitans sp.]